MSRAKSAEAAEKKLERACMSWQDAKKRRSEATYASAAAGLRPACRDSVNRKCKQHVIRKLVAFVIHGVPDAQSAWRRTPCAVPGWRRGRQPGCSLRVLRLFECFDVDTVGASH